jgi:hypothetical protein
MSAVTKARSDLALKTRWRDPGDPEITKARAALAEAKLVQHIRRARELSEEQRSRAWPHSCSLQVVVITMTSPPNGKGRSRESGPQKITDPGQKITIAIDSSGLAVTGTLAEIVALLANEQELRAVRHILNAVWDHSESPHALEFLAIVDDVLHRRAA